MSELFVLYQGYDETTRKRKLGRLCITEEELGEIDVGSIHNGLALTCIEMLLAQWTRLKDITILNWRRMEEPVDNAEPAD